MPQFTFTSPDGRAYDVTGPAGATKEQAFQMLHGHLNQPPPAAPGAPPPAPPAAPPIAPPPQGVTKAAIRKPGTPAVTTSGAAPPPATTPPPPAGTAPPPTTTPPPATTPPPVDYSPSYENYLKVRQSQDQSAFSETGGSNLPPLITQEQWNSMSLKDRVAAVTDSANVYAILPGDPRYDALAQQTGAEPGRGIVITSNVPHQGDPKYWVDPSKVIDLGNGMFAYAPNNQTPAAEAEANATTLAGKIIWGLTGAAFGYGAYSAFADAGALGAAAPAAEGGASGGLDAGGLMDGLDLSTIPPISAGDITPLTSLDPALAADTLTDGLDLSALGTTPAGEITPLQPGPFDGGGLPFDVANAIPDNVQLQPPPDISGTDLMPTIPGGSIGDLLTPQNLLRAGSLATSVFSATRKPSIPDALKNNNTPADNKPILDAARQIILNNGAPTPDQKGGIDAIIDRQIREASAAIKQRAINSGMGADSMVTQQQINTMTENANGLRAQLYMQQAQQNITNALKEWGMANTQDLEIQKLIAQYQLQSDKDSQALAANISKAFGWLASIAGG